jgi:hypothetical protein
MVKPPPGSRIRLLAIEAVRIDELPDVADQQDRDQRHGRASTRRRGAQLRVQGRQTDQTEEDQDEGAPRPNEGQVLQRQRHQEADLRGDDGAPEPPVAAEQHDGNQARDEEERKVDPGVDEDLPHERDGGREHLRRSDPARQRHVGESDGVGVGMDDHVAQLRHEGEQPHRPHLPGCAHEQRRGEEVDEHGLAEILPVPGQLVGEHAQQQRRTHRCLSAGLNTT